MKSFAHALDAIPLLSVVENSALLPIDMLTMLKSRQIKVLCSLFLVPPFFVYYQLASSVIPTCVMPPEHSYRLLWY
jgi:hypothetical protein